MFLGRDYENPFLVPAMGFKTHKEVNVDLVPFLYTTQLTACVGIAFSLKDEKGQVSKIGLYHSNAEHSEDTEEYAKKYLSPDSEEPDGTSAELMRTVDQFLKDAKKPEEITVTIQVNLGFTSSAKFDAPLIYNLIVSVWNIRNPTKTIKHAETLKDCKSFNFQAKASQGPNFCILRTGFAGNLLNEASSQEKEMVAKALLNFLSKKIESWSPKKPKKNKPIQPEMVEEEKQTAAFQKLALEVIAKAGDNKMSVSNACQELLTLADKYQCKFSQDITGYLNDFDEANILQISSPTPIVDNKENKDFKLGP